MSALFVAANDECIDLGADPNLPGDQARLTIDAWIKPTGTLADMRIIDKSEDTITIPWLLGIANSSGKGKFVVDDTTLVGATNIPKDVWSHLLGTYDGVNMKLYLDAVLDGTQAEVSNVPSTADNCRIACAAADSTIRNFNGNIYRIRVFDRAMLLAEIQSIFEAGGADEVVQGLFYEFKLTEGGVGEDIGASVVVNSGPQTLANGSGEGDAANLPSWDDQDLQVYQPAA